MTLHKFEWSANPALVSVRQDTEIVGKCLDFEPVVKSMPVRFEGSVHCGSVTGNSRPLCASIDYVHENVGDPANKLRTRFMLHIILAVAVVKLSLPARPNCLLPGLQGQRSEGDLEMHLS